MRLNAPTKLAWLIALILGILGLIGELGNVQFLNDYSFWFMFAGWLLLVLAPLFKGL